MQCEKLMRYYTLIFILLLIFSCSTPETSKNSAKDSASTLISNNNKTETEFIEEKPKPMNTEFLPSGDSIQIPTFEIFVDLDENANAKLSEINETIIVKAFFRGIPKDTSNEEYEEFDHYTIGVDEIELNNSHVARFENIYFSKTDLEELVDNNFEVLINIFSGRKSSNLNLLDCNILQEPINDIKGRRIHLKGKLL